MKARFHGRRWRQAGSGIVLLLFLLALSACGGSSRVPFPALPGPIGADDEAEAEEEVPPPSQAQVSIVDLREAISTDRRTVLINGALINQGSGPTRELMVRVHGNDSMGHTLFTQPADLSSDFLMANGGTATFSAVVENHPDVERYHVEIVAR